MRVIDGGRLERPAEVRRARPGGPAPVNPVPPVVWALFGAMVGVELVFQLAEQGWLGGRGGIGWRIWAIERFGFFDAVFEDQWVRRRWLDGDSLRLVAYPFLHLGMGHAAFAAVFVLALGKFVGEVFSAVSMVVLFFATSVAGAVLYAVLLDEPRQLVGGYPAAYGFIGAYTFLMWHGLSRAGENQWRAFALIGFLLGIQLLFGLLFGGDRTWVADAAGFATGLVLSPVLAPGGMRALRQRLRR